VALVDADTIAHSTWLRELATALDEPRIGAATGNRWYFPPDFAAGSLVRYLWNAAAVVQMYSYGIAWGGTLALRLADVRRIGWLDRVGQAFCEDTMLRTLLNRHGLRVQFVPSLLMANRERCNLDGFYQWVTRQLLTARLYHAYWPLVVGHGVATTIGIGAGLAFLLVAASTGQAAVAAWLGIGLAVYYAFMIGLLVLMEVAVRTCLRARGESSDWITPGTALMMLPCIVATQIVYAAALVRAALLRMVAWRGVTYEIRGPWQVRLVQDQPFQEAPAATQQRVSL
jgi:cellulose synthase/poly-beta-1,6-N-acetylglucosamine synthase-like glycosyltransferase